MLRNVGSTAISRREPDTTSSKPSRNLIIDLEKCCSLSWSGSLWLIAQEGIGAGIRDRDGKNKKHTIVFLEVTLLFLRSETFTWLARDNCIRWSFSFYIFSIGWLLITKESVH